MGRKIPLGTPLSTGKAVVTQPESVEEMVQALQSQVEKLTMAFYDAAGGLISDRRYDSEYSDPNYNKDGVPFGIALIGTSTRGGVHVLNVATDGYYIGPTRYDSLSQAAEAASGVRRSGWAFWKLSDGRTAKEAFGKG